jgi:hypothetical protein
VTLNESKYLSWIPKHLIMEEIEKKWEMKRPQLGNKD